MIPRDDIYDSQELTRKLCLFMTELLENHDSHICKNVFTASFSYVLYTYFDSPDKQKKFVDQVFDCVAFVEKIKETK